uniref:Uncharacterized protein LOC114338663 n=1 Tax=Diabrotica virgifera virgifera TaxID=50390 RepID=A0A6P7GG43_DIAVI
CLAICLDKPQKACLLCGKVFRESDAEKPIQCQTPECLGLYCAECFADLRNLCTVCLSPIEYGDLSDLSEERDSSEDERIVLKKKGTKDKKSKSKSSCKSLFNICSRKRSTYSDTTPLLPISLKDTTPTGVLSKLSLRRSQNINEDESLFQKSLELDRVPPEDFNVDEESVSLLSKEEVDELDDVDDEEVLALFKKTSDSGHSSTTSSTELYSYSYQYQKSEQKLNSWEIPSRDVEKQDLPDYASMDTFREESDEEFVASENLDESISEGEIEDEYKFSRTKYSSTLTNVEELPLDTDAIQKSYTEMDSTEKERVDVGTSISGDTISRAKQNKRIEFIGVQERDSPKRKIKRKKKRKLDSSKCFCSTSEEELQPLYRGTKKSTISISTSPKRERHSTKTKQCISSCDHQVSKCNFPTDCSNEEENTTNSNWYEQPFEVDSLIDMGTATSSKNYKESENIELKDVSNKGESSQFDSGTSGQEKKKSNKLKMFFGKVMPKYKIQKEK